MGLHPRTPYEAGHILEPSDFLLEICMGNIKKLSMDAGKCISVPTRNQNNKIPGGADVYISIILTPGRVFNCSCSLSCISVNIWKTLTE